MDLSQSLRGRSVLITGASSGFGAHFAGLMARAGARIAIAARRIGELEAMTAELTAAGAADVLAVRMDVSDAASIDAGFAAIDDRFGGLDILVNNAGIGVQASAIDQPVDSYDQVMAVNLRGPWLAAQAAARRWRTAKRGGVILNIASITGLRAMNGLAAYSVSKAALIHMTESLAMEWARFGIRVNALAPGYFATPINAEHFQTEAGKALIQRMPMRRLGRYEDLDGPFLLLVSDASRYMTGSVVTVDGGHTIASL
ncbi:SDR family NAD(P)-dependent oxidoreductase [Prosthecomicrobium hirschii]|uniref:SDR family NAD(P)-dependent oxidoreductase n=1 Tax=Prosthecodimorpha hirschii TaxID=665126 RepID=UPI00112EA9BB|nr:glucose 1-dehydrogenase [Prosthecomicrobium hirschii]MCW1838774.1 glucose 1-dehydrogenase [Prosthecomicrobium hirschii]TPQ51849.1 2-deoxy-D-gluconate 3-dehydrogenase [Prosthecomicrobium hirschii]